MKKILFIHRSVGENAIVQGSLYSKLSQTSIDLEFSDFNQNTSVYRDMLDSKNTDFKMPGENTRPKDYSSLFSGKHSKLLDFVLDFDIIIIKSCYPNSNIKNKSELEQIKSRYSDISKFFIGKTDKKLIILSSPPLQPLMTSRSNANKARELAVWLETTKLGSNVSVINLHNLLADKSGRLNIRYRRILPFNSHPNKKANKLIAQELANYLSRI